MLLRCDPVRKSERAGGAFRGLLGFPNGRVSARAFTCTAWHGAGTRSIRKQDLYINARYILQMALQN